MHSWITVHISTCLLTNNESMIIKDGRFISVIQSGNITISMIPVQPTVSVDISSNTTSTDFTEKLSLVPDHIDHSISIIPSLSNSLKWLVNWWFNDDCIQQRFVVKPGWDYGVPSPIIDIHGIHESCGLWPLWVAESWGMFGTVSASAPLTENDGTPFPPQLSISTGIHESCGPRQTWLTG